MDGFEDLKLGPELIEALRRLGYRQPSALQREAVPVIARGTNAVGVASSGSGKTLAIGLGLALRLEPETPGLRALVLRPSDDAASATADAIQPLLQARGLQVALLDARHAVPGQVAVASPATALAALEHSAMKLESLVAFAVDGIAAVFTLGAAESLETLASQVPKAAQRIVLTAAMTKEVEGWLSRHAHRARQLTYLPGEPDPLRDATVEFYATPRHNWLTALLGWLDRQAPKPAGPIVVRCRGEAEAVELGLRLTVRGIAIGDSTSTAPVRIEPDDTAAAEAGALTVFWGAPLDYEGFHGRLAPTGRSIVLLEPRELPHLERLAALVSARLNPLKTPPARDALDSTQQTRDELREAARVRDLEPYLLLLEPLFADFTPTQIAAAATALLRDRTPERPTQLLPAWTRLYFGVGRRDGVRPADLVGAITGESSVGGDRIGRIEVRESHSSVEVAAAAADQVIKSLARATIRGRPANVRVFRE